MAKFYELNITRRELITKKVIKYVHKKQRPVTIGEVALDVGESIEIIEERMGALTQLERVPPRDPDMQQYDERVVLFRLVRKPALHIAHMDVNVTE